jgi:hypothetical protein
MHDILATIILHLPTVRLVAILVIGFVFGIMLGIIF